MSFEDSLSEYVEVLSTPGKKYSKLDKYIAISCIEKILKGRKEELKEAAVGVLDKQGGSYAFLDMKASSSERKNWDYSVSPEHKRLTTLKSELEKRMKASAETEGEFIMDGEIVPKAEIKSVTKSITVR